MKHTKAQPPDSTPTQPDNFFVVSSRLIAWVPVIGFLLGICMWPVDAFVDAYVLKTDGSYWESLWSGHDAEIWMRALVVIVMTGAAFIAQYFMRKQKMAEFLLIKHKHNLECLVEERTCELERLASTDSLTGLFNRRKFCEVVDTEIQRARRYPQPLSLVMCDMDHFKRINDNFGHSEGDRVLLEVAEIFRQHLRQSDSCARWGGEEFIVLLPHTSLNEARAIAEKLRNQMHVIQYGSGEDSLTASFGVSELHKDEECDQFVKRADDALYKAKGAGRNSVQVQT